MPWRKVGNAKEITVAGVIFSVSADGLTLTDEDGNTFSSDAIGIPTKSLTDGKKVAREMIRNMQNADWRFDQAAGVLCTIPWLSRVVLPFYITKTPRVGIEYDITFHRSCLAVNTTTYEPGRPSECVGDYNKILYISGLTAHHTNSMNFGWKADGENIHIGPYFYKDGDRYTPSSIGGVSVKPGYPTRCKMMWDSSRTVRWWLNGSLVHVETGLKLASIRFIRSGWYGGGDNLLRCGAPVPMKYKLNIR